MPPGAIGWLTQFSRRFPLDTRARARVDKGPRGASIGLDRRSLSSERATGNAVRDLTPANPQLPPQLYAASPCHRPLGQTREGGDGQRPASQETCRRFGRASGGVPRRRSRRGRALRKTHPRTAPGPGVLPQGAARVAFTDIAQTWRTEAEIDAAATVIAGITC